MVDLAAIDEAVNRVRAGRLSNRLKEYQLGSMQRQEQSALATAGREAEGRRLKGLALSGAPGAETQLQTDFPDEAIAFQKHAASMDEAQRKETSFMFENIGKALKSVEDAPPMMKYPAYQEARSWAINQLGIPEDQIPEQYDQDFVARQINMAKTATQVFAEPDKPKYGQPKVGMVGGKQVFFQADPEGNIQQVEGITPPPKKGMSITLPDGTVVQMGGSADLQKSTMGKIESKAFDATNTLSRLNEISSRYKPEYLEFDTQFSNWVTAKKEKLGFDIGSGDLRDLEEYTAFKRDTFANLNKTLNELSGAAVSEHEMKRLVKELPDVGTDMLGGDSPREFKSKLDATVKSVKRAIIRYNYALKNNLDPTKTGIDLADVDKLIDRRGTELEKAIRTQSPDLSIAEIRAMVKKQLKEEFE